MPSSPEAGRSRPSSRRPRHSSPTCPGWGWASQASPGDGAAKVADGAPRHARNRMETRGRVVITGLQHYFFLVRLIFRIQGLRIRTGLGKNFFKNPSPVFFFFEHRARRKYGHRARNLRFRGEETETRSADRSQEGAWNGQEGAAPDLGLASASPSSSRRAQASQSKCSPSGLRSSPAWRRSLRPLPW